MERQLADLVTFHHTGKRAGGTLEDVAERKLRPALFAGYKNLAQLRYDYPAVLTVSDRGGAFVRSLSGIVDSLLQEVAPRGVTGERQRKHLLALEAEIRARVAGGAKGSLDGLWRQAESALLTRSEPGEREGPEEAYAVARGALAVDGEVVDCDAELPERLLTHAWRTIERAKAGRYRRRIDELVLKLGDILKADYMRSEAGRSPEALRESVGTAFESTLDFEKLAAVLPKASPNDALPAARRRRLEATLEVLKTQRFFPAIEARAEAGAEPEPYAFFFDGCTGALEAFDARLPEMVALIKAVAVAELEIENRYKEEEHDSFFARLDAGALLPRDLVPFPSYLVCLREGHYDVAERAKLLEVLASDLPVRVLLESEDLLGPPVDGALHLSMGGRSRELTSMAVGMSGSYVMQAASANLYRLRDRILKGLMYRGPALFSIFTGSPRWARNMPLYLAAAAAVESRAFPAFTYDPAAGGDWASRFSIFDNAQAEDDWPVQTFAYEDDDQQRVSEDVAFTFVDFAACDARYAGHFASVPRRHWHGGMTPVREYLDLADDGAGDRVPYILMVDDDDRLHRVVVDDKLIDATRRCREMWRGLQELGGIHNSHAAKLLERERKLWEEEKARELEALKSQAAATAASAATAATAPAEVPAPTAPAAAAPAIAAAAEVEAEAPVEEAPSDEAYIETPRCTTCDECTQINNRMFAYDDNKQAYIADADAGTYRELVEAAESCQVAIIHPGKPRNPDEPGLEELRARAQPFL